VTDGLDAMNDYLARLPAGIDSHPECRMKGAAVRAMLDSFRGFTPPPGTPAAILDMLAHPPAPSGWANEVPCHALMLIAAYDLFGGESGYLDNVLTGNRALFDSLVYRILFRFVSAKKILRQVDERWLMFHTGTTLECEAVREHHCVLVLRGPAQHVPLLVGKGYGMAIRAAIEAAGAANVEFDASGRSPHEISFDVRWT
jgi:hypothetical protein